MKPIALSCCLIAMLTTLGCGDPEGTDGNGGSPETCADCIGAALGPNDTNPAISCTSAGEPYTCTCLDQMEVSHTVYMSAEGCF
jgi:hypothetical protein